MNKSKDKKAPVIFGIAGTRLTEDEIEFFKKVKPFGYILFKRNIESKEQVTELTSSLRKINGDENIPILVDQEGGRVARLRPPVVEKQYPPAKHFGDMAEKDLASACKATFENYQAIGKDLKSCGINVDCAPVADLFVKSAHEVIGDRSFGESVKIVAALCEAACSGLLSEGVQPIIKHLPGHGRAECDSHEALPVVKTDIATLENTDFKVFKDLSHLPMWAMTAHIVFENLDKENCITISKPGIEYVRSNLGYQNHIIMSDDLSMKALKHTTGENAVAALSAGCDLALHCNGKMEEMVDIHQSISLHPEFYENPRIAEV
jgi:beta-N-acetylhexosaminidase